MRRFPGKIPTDQRMTIRDKKKKSSLKSLLQIEEVLLQLEQVNRDIQGEPRGLENEQAEHRLILILIYLASPKGELPFLLGHLSASIPEETACGITSDSYRNHGGGWQCAQGLARASSLFHLWVDDPAECWSLMGSVTMAGEIQLLPQPWSGGREWRKCIACLSLLLPPISPSTPRLTECDS